MNNVCPAEVTGAIVPYPANGTFYNKSDYDSAFVETRDEVLPESSTDCQSFSVLINFIQGVVTVYEKKGL